MVSQVRPQAMMSGDAGTLVCGPFFHVQHTKDICIYKLLDHLHENRYENM